MSFSSYTRRHPLYGHTVTISPRRLRIPDGPRPAPDFGPFKIAKKSSEGCPFCSIDPQSEVIVGERGQAICIESRFPYVDRSGERAYGLNEVIVLNPSHERLLHELEESNIADFLSLAAARVSEHSMDAALQYSIISVSEGPAAAATKEHLHGQVKSTSLVSPLNLKLSQKAGGNPDQKCVLCKMASESAATAYAQNEHFAVFFPPASLTFCNTLIVPRAHTYDISPDSQLLPPLASALKEAMAVIYAMTKGDSYKLAIHIPRYNHRSVVPFHCFLEIRPQAKPTGVWEDTGEFIIPGFPEEWALQAREELAKIRK